MNTIKIRAERIESGTQRKTERNFKERKRALINYNLTILKDFYDFAYGSPSNKNEEKEKQYYIDECREKLQNCNTTISFDKTFSSMRDMLLEIEEYKRKRFSGVIRGMR